MDKLTPERRSENMRRIRSKNSSPEMNVRRLVHAMGYRYRLHGANLPGKPDLVFAGRRKIIFVHGCFWHQHQDRNCRESHQPSSNRDYWKPKLERNVARDAQHDAALRSAGWSVLIIWECEIEPVERLRDRLTAFLEA